MRQVDTISKVMNNIEGDMAVPRSMVRDVAPTMIYELLLH